ALRARPLEPHPHPALVCEPFLLLGPAAVVPGVGFLGFAGLTARLLALLARIGAVLRRLQQLFSGPGPLERGLGLFEALLGRVTVVPGTGLVEQGSGPM